MKNNNPIRATGTIFILIIGLIHLINFPEESQGALYMGVLFIVFFLLSVISAIGIQHGQVIWGWELGDLLSLGAITAYLVSRTVGFPISGKEEWGPPIAFFSIFLEVLFFASLIRFSRPYLHEAPC